MDISHATALELTWRNAYAVIGGRRYKTEGRVRDNLAETRTTKGPKEPGELSDHQRHLIIESFARFPVTDVTPAEEETGEQHIKISVTLPASQVKRLKAEARKTGEKLSRVVSRHLER